MDMDSIRYLEEAIMILDNMERDVKQMKGGINVKKHLKKLWKGVTTIAPYALPTLAAIGALTGATAYAVKHPKNNTFGPKADYLRKESAKPAVYNVGDYYYSPYTGDPYYSHEQYL